MSEFDEGDLVDVNSETVEPSEEPQLTPEQEKNIDAAMEEVFGDRSAKELEAEAEKDGDKAGNAAADRRAARRHQRQAEAKEELEADGLENDEEEAEVEPAEKVEAEPEGEAEEKEQTGEQEAEAPVLDPTIRYLAETELGMKPEDIDRFVKADPVLASTTLNKLVEEYNNVSRSLLANSTPNAGPVSPDTPAPTVYSPTPKLDKFFAELDEQFVANNGEELTNFLKVLKEELVNPFKEERARQEQKSQELLRQEAVDTVVTLRERFPKLYGNGESRTAEQEQSLRELAKMADDLRTVAKQRGREIGPREALNRAHAVVSAKYAGEIARAELKDKVVTRGRSTISRPSTRSNKRATEEKPSRERAEKAVAEWAAEKGIEGFDI